MIIGNGIDLCRISRVKRMLDDHGDTFLDRILDSEEKAFLKNLAPAKHANACAKFWAAKEACAKALGTGIGKEAGFHEIRLFRNSVGAPKLKLSGRALERAQSMVPASMNCDFLITMTDEFPFVVASVIFQAIPQSYTPLKETV